MVACDSSAPSGPGSGCKIRRWELGAGQSDIERVKLRLSPPSFGGPSEERDAWVKQGQGVGAIGGDADWDERLEFGIKDHGQLSHC
jgi:hypothetical protein